MMSGQDAPQDIHGYVRTRNTTAFEVHLKVKLPLAIRNTLRCVDYYGDDWEQRCVDIALKLRTFGIWSIDAWLKFVKATLRPLALMLIAFTLEAILRP